MARRRRRFRRALSFKQRIDVVLVFASALLVFGLVVLALAYLLPPWKNVGWPQVAGASLFATGLSVLISTLTGRQAIHEQYAKEANLQRKREIYGPLHSELKALRIRLDGAHEGTSPYPETLQMAGKIVGLPMMQGHYPRLVLQWWPAFKQDFRIDNFSEETQKQFDDLYHLVNTCLQAVEATRAPTCAVLERHVTSAIEALVSSDAYQTWHSHHIDEQEEFRLSSDRDDPVRWYGFIAFLLSYPEETPLSIGRFYAREWLNLELHGPAPATFATLGWLLAKHPDQAAEEIQRQSASDQHHRRWDLSWLQDIFNATWADLQNEPTYHAVWKTERKLFQSLQKTETKLADAMHIIRERYEGGEPLI